MLCTVTYAVMVTVHAHCDVTSLQSADLIAKSHRVYTCTACDSFVSTLNTEHQGRSVVQLLAKNDTWSVLS